MPPVATDMERVLTLNRRSILPNESILLITVNQARNQLGTPGGGEEFYECGPNFLNYVQRIFPGEKFSRGLPPLVTGLL